VGETTTTDPRAQRNRAGRRGGQLLTRALSPPNKTGLPTPSTPGAPVPDGRTVIQPRLQPHKGPAASGTGGADTFIPVTNPLERVNKEIKRRTDVVGVFPNPAALLRLAGAVLAEIHDEWQVSHRRYLSETSMAQLTDPPPEPTKEVAPPALIAS
jgi:Transposase, Mutator family